MKIVIDIPEQVYNTLIETGNYGYYSFDAKKAIKNGTPLPKGHGRLIDADALNISHGVFLPKVGENKYGCPMDAVFADEIEEAPTIIEADREVENG